MIALITGAACAMAVGTRAAAEEPELRRLQLSDKFYSEGAYYADFNKDGKLDVVAGPFLFHGPDFKPAVEYRQAEEVDPKSYSGHFMTFTGDFNGDGWADILAIPFPGNRVTWYENPAGKEPPWKEHDTGVNADGESPCWGDINGDGRPDLVHCMGGSYGYSTYDPAAADKPWTFVRVTNGGGYNKFTHGQGYGDINGDGRMDLLDANGWLEQPAEGKPSDPWKKHAVKFADAAANLVVTDVDGDGHNDVITAHHAHGYGIYWYRQTRDEEGSIGFEQNVILTPNPDVKSDALRISQLHAFDLADFNGDGVMDFVTGKRFWAHNGGDPESDAPAVLYWFEARRNADKTAAFIPHLIDDNSGVGVQVAATDLDGDKTPDVIVGNKKGIFLFLSKK